MATFTSLPLEVRDMIYGLVVVYENPVPITSPMSTHKCRNSVVCKQAFMPENFKTSSPKDFANLSRTSKQINTEASIVFFSQNTFIVGNGRFHSPHHPNVHAIRLFKQRTPPDKMALICRIESGMVFGRTVLNRGPCFSDMQTINRTLGKCFHGIERVGLHLHGELRFNRPDIQIIASSVELLLKLGKLKEILYDHKDLLSKLPGFVEKTLKASHESGRVVKVILDSSEVSEALVVSPL